MNDLTDTVLAAIDATVQAVTVERCASCGRRLPTGQRARSLYFCGEDCQTRWHDDRVFLRETPPEPVWDAAAERDARTARAVSRWQGLPDTPVLEPVPAANHNALSLRDVFAGIGGDTNPGEPCTCHACTRPRIYESLRTRACVDAAARNRVRNAWRAGIAATFEARQQIRFGNQFAEATRLVFETAVPPLQALAEQLRQAGDAADALVRSCPEAFAVDPAQLDVQHEGAGDSLMQQAIRAKRHRTHGPQPRRGVPPRMVTPPGAWIRITR